jgi:lipid-A-disaccharide synthase
MKYYIIAGEASGDLHGSNLIKALLHLDKKADVRCWGGDKMEAAGGKLVKHYRDLAFMGFVEVIKNLPTIFKNLSFCKKDILSFQPDALILIDYPGFNMRIAKWARLQNLKIIYYISPQIWAWKENRVHAIRRDVDKMLVILPFEKDFYKKWSYDVEYVGHPLIEVIEEFKASGKKLQLSGDVRPVIALLPGSRKQEIATKLPIMLSVAEHFKDYKFVVAQAPGLDPEFYKPMLEKHDNVSAVTDKTYELLSVAKAALVTSGTATLETALFDVPEIICYKGNNISYEIAKKLIRIKYIGLVNLIMDKAVVKELIQHELNTVNLITELNLLLNDENKKNQVQKDYGDLKAILKAGGNASHNAATSIFNILQPLAK